MAFFFKDLGLPTLRTGNARFASLLRTMLRIMQGLERHTRAWLRSRAHTGPLTRPSPPPSAPSVQDDQEVHELLGIQTEALLLAEAMQHLEHELQRRRELATEDKHGDEERGGSVASGAEGDGKE